MQFTIDQALLAEGLRTAGRAVSTRNTIPVLSGICLCARGQALRLRATDLEVAISLSLPASVRSEGEIVLPGRYLQELVRRLPPVPLAVSVNMTNATARIAWDESESVIHGFPAAQFPAAAEPAPAQPAITMGCDALATVLRETGFATAHDESRPWFTGVFLSVQGSQAVAMATDQAIIAYSEAAVHNPGGSAFSVILPGRSLQELGRLLAGRDDSLCEIVPSQNQLGFHLGSLTLTTRLLEGQYPDFRRYLPSEFPSQVRLDLARFLAACERAALAADQGAVRLEATDAGLRLSARAPELGELTERLPAVLEGPAFAVPLSVKYLLEGLRSLTGPDVVLEFAGTRTAVRFRASTEARSFFAVMPLTSF